LKGSASLISHPLSLETLRSAYARRVAAITVAVLLEALLLLMLLGLAPSFDLHQEGKALKVFTIAADNASHRTSDNASPRQNKAPERTEKSQPPPTPPAVTPKVIQPPPVVQPPLPAPAANPAPPTPAPAAPAPPRRVYGPPAPGPDPNDTPVVGSAPNGEPLYAASWYREPYDDELRGYLSTAQGPGWALIACRTVRDFRVEDCVGLNEYPEGSKILRAVLAAAWQFRVRPPLRGGEILWGAWVRIRIDYGDRPTGRAPYP